MNEIENEEICKMELTEIIEIIKDIVVVATPVVVVIITYRGNKKIKERYSKCNFIN